MSDKPSTTSSDARIEARILGLVQGVGFRPFVAKLARRIGLKGYVINDGRGVFVDVEGPSDRVDEFFVRLESEAPPLARITSVEKHDRERVGYDSFTIKESVQPDVRFALISPDIATCEDCLREMREPSDRRHRYPFINCTNCGPRFTIIYDVPYDRERTTMCRFVMCEDCGREYADDTDRRFHAEPIACPVCGPSVRLVNRAGTPVPGDPIARAVQIMSEGGIVSVKGLGGYHLACLASSELAVSTLRKRKCREEKPLAIMVRDLEVARSICRISDSEEILLVSPERPIVLLRKRENIPIADEVSPRNKYLGVMLPYTPLHHLLLERVPALVMTSGNLTDEPISFRDDEAEVRLGGIADYFLVHNRDIFTRCDDSVARVVKGRTHVVRRSRGYVPNPLVMPFQGPSVLAVGAELKNTFCLVRENLAFPGHHIGDLKNLEAYEALKFGIEHLKKLLFVDPELIAHDMHPDYLSTRYALESGLPLVAVQHHHAHIAACMAENGITEKVIGLSFDGTGYGTDGTVWGGEILIADYADFERVAHLARVPLPGGEAAINEPWRMAASYLHAAHGGAFTSLKTPLLERVERKRIETVVRMIERNVNSIPTSSLGRLFDAVAALVGLRDFVSFEGQAAMELEMAASDEAVGAPYPYRIDSEVVAVEHGAEGDGKDGRTVRLLDFRETVAAIAEDAGKGTPVSQISRNFHETVALSVGEVCHRLRGERGLNDVCMSGGVFQNSLLTTLLSDSLDKAGFRVHVHTRVPPNDGGLALGQAAIAMSRMRGKRL